MRVIACGCMRYSTSIFNIRYRTLSTAFSRCVNEWCWNGYIYRKKWVTSIYYYSILYDYYCYEYSGVFLIDKPCSSVTTTHGSYKTERYLYS